MHQQNKPKPQNPKTPKPQNPSFSQIIELIEMKSCVYKGVVMHLLERYDAA